MSGADADGADSRPTILAIAMLAALRGCSSSSQPAARVLRAVAAGARRRRADRDRAGRGLGGPGRCCCGGVRMVDRAMLRLAARPKPSDRGQDAAAGRQRASASATRARTPSRSRSSAVVTSCGASCRWRSAASSAGARPPAARGWRSALASDARGVDLVTAAPQRRDGRSARQPDRGLARVAGSGASGSMTQ